MIVKKEFKKDSVVIEYTTSWEEKMLEFFEEAKTHNITNNLSFKDMKWELGKWWLTIDNNKIVGVSGCHPLPEGQTKSWRVMVRAAILPQYRNPFKNLTRSNINSETTHYHMPLQIAWIKKNFSDAEQFLFTTNIDNENPIYKKSNRACQIMEETGIVKKIGIETIYYTQQTVWEVNEDILLSIRREFRERLGYDPADLDNLI